MPLFQIYFVRQRVFFETSLLTNYIISQYFTRSYTDSNVKSLFLAGNKISVFYCVPIIVTSETKHISIVNMCVLNRGLRMQVKTNDLLSVTQLLIEFFRSFSLYSISNSNKLSYLFPFWCQPRLSLR